MKGRFVLDAWTVLALLQKEELAALRVKRLLEDAEESNIELFISIINLGEVIYRIGKIKGENEAQETLDRFAACP
jgi:PIN domain nuclease of toxin-antitoxin system